MQLFYIKPADRWEETLPIGNGSLGAMVFGGIAQERLGLNEENLWSGYYKDKNNPAALQYLPAVRQLILSGQNTEAERMIQDHMLGEYNESYLPLGDLLITFRHGEASNYRRSLDLQNAIASVKYEAEGRGYRREYFASYPAHALLLAFTCDQPALAFTLRFDSQLRTSVQSVADGWNITGKCPEHVDPSYISDRTNPILQGARGMAFAAQLRVLEHDGTLVNREGTLEVSGATRVVLAFSAVKPAQLDGAGYEALKAAHIRDYRGIYDKVELVLGEQLPLPTDERLRQLREGQQDNGLFALYFQYGRYLLISSSRQGSLPANLQGIWSWQVRAPWSSNWTTNINAQMNYWPAQSCNLQECLPPYFDLMDKLCQEGQKTAATHYGCRGFVLHHNADYWCNTNPVGIVTGESAGRDGSVTWALWPMGGAWMTSELFRHYEYNPDAAFLRQRALPLLRQAALFLVDWLVEHEGRYITCPSTSPENRFVTADGDTCAVATSSAMDLAIIREVFHNYGEACRILGEEDPLLAQIDERLARLTPFQTGSYGQLLEWDQEYPESEPGHRHISHLYGLFPSELFGDDEAMKEACRISLDHRLANGGGHTGWSCAWILNVLAVLGDGERAYEFLHTLLTRSTYDNLWDAHPPFQIDGNFGGIAGIANLLVQDRNGQVKLLPALPKAFPDGSVRGLRIKGGKTVDIRWQGGQLVEHRIY